ncbi:MAG: hypothetical protein M3Q97_05440 [Bacteroidota bacterium]|nr:hypothetical protein [Bacteroidota bacterium]
MKFIASLAPALFIALQIYAQPPKDARFNTRVFFSDFTEADQGVWPLKNNQDYLLLLREGQFIMESRQESNKGYLPPKWRNPYSEYRMEMEITLDKAKEYTGTAGLFFGLKEDLSAGYLFEINAQKQYRISILQGPGKYRRLSNAGKNEGWVDYKKLDGAGKANTITIQQELSRIRIWINETFVQTYMAEEPAPGLCGLYISGINKAYCGRFSVMATGDLEKKPAEAGKAGQKDTARAAVNTKVPPGNTTDTADNSAYNADLMTLSNALSECRRNNSKLTADYELVNTRLKEANKKIEELQSFINNNLDVKLQQQVDAQTLENERLRKENEELKKQNADLQQFKTNIEAAQDGDVIVVLNNQISELTKKNRELLDRIKKLEEENKLQRGN